MSKIKKKHLSSRNYEVIEAIAAFGLSFLVKEMVNKGYEKITQKPAPENPNDSHSGLKEVIIYSLCLAVVSTGVKLLVRGGIANKWENLKGDLPKRLS